MQRTLLRFDLFTFFPSTTKLSSTTRYINFHRDDVANVALGYIRGIPLSYPYLLAFITFPVCAFKNWINVIQMVNAAKALAEVDKEDRLRDGLVTAPRPKRSTAGKRSRIED